MTVCGKSLPPRAALLLIFDFTSLVLVMPVLFMVPLIAHRAPAPISAMFLTFLRLIMAGLACQAVFYYNELYNLQIVQRSRSVVVRVLRTFGLLFIALALTCLALPRLAPSLSRVVSFAFLLAIIAILARMLALPRIQERVLVLSTGESASDLQEAILECPEWNLDVVQILDPARLHIAIPPLSEPRVICDRIIVSDPERQSDSVLATLLQWKMGGLPIEEAQRFYERATGRVLVDTLTAHQCIFSDSYDNTLTKKRMKRFFDATGATVILLVTLPVVLVVALLIWLEFDGPVLFRQERIGHNGRSFRILKFRSMTPAEPGRQARWAGEEDDRITPLGALLRKYRLDELPQLVNILRGEMSLVGPRPEQPSFCRMLAECIPFYDQRHCVHPGLTGWAQVKYHYGSTILESKRKLEFDLFYVKHLSIWLDCAILIETVKVVLVGRGAR